MQDPKHRAMYRSFVRDQARLLRDLVQGGSQTTTGARGQGSTAYTGGNTLKVKHNSQGRGVCTGKRRARGLGSQVIPGCFASVIKRCTHGCTNLA